MSRVYLPRVVLERDDYRFVEVARDLFDESITEIVVERREPVVPNAMGKSYIMWVPAGAVDQRALRAALGLPKEQPFFYDGDKPYYDLEEGE